MERENIIAQSLLGREEKAKSGGWNGGFAPYGYKLENGQLIVQEDEAVVIREICGTRMERKLKNHGRH